MLKPADELIAALLRRLADVSQASPRELVRGNAASLGELNYALRDMIDPVRMPSKPGMRGRWMGDFDKY